MFVLIDNMEFEILFSDCTEPEYSWRILITKNDCLLENLQTVENVSCINNEYYQKIDYNIWLKSQEIIWFSWDPYNAEYDGRTFSFGVGSKLDSSIIATLNIYGDKSRGINSRINCVTFLPPLSGESITISVMQFATPKICLSQSGELIKSNLGTTWKDDCDSTGWEMRKKVQIYNDDSVHFYGKQEKIDEIFQSPITNLETDAITKITSDCFHGPFGGSDIDNLTNFGDYTSRFFYVLTDVNRDIIHIDLNYYGLATWNPELYENDTAYVFINHNAIWKSSPQYEFVNEYCQGYDMYSDWFLSLEHNDVLTPQLIPALNLLNQKCSYPVSVEFRHEGKNALYFSLGIGAKLNQLIGNEAFGFSSVSVSYNDCPDIIPLPIGNVIKQPFENLDDYIWNTGDMLIISSNSIYYLVATQNDDLISCTFTLYGGYKLWSQISSDCTIAGLEIMQNYYLSTTDSNDDSIEIGLSNEGVLSLQLQLTGETVWSRRTPCNIDTAYFYYSMNKTNLLRFFKNVVDNSLYSIDCKWRLIITRDGPINVVKNIDESNDYEGEVVWSNGTQVERLEFDEDGSLILYDVNDDNKEINTTLSPKGADFMIFDQGKLILFDYDDDEIVKQFDYIVSECKLDETIGFIKYHHFMKPGDILWNGEVLISQNCQYKLILTGGDLKILDNSNIMIWQQDLKGIGGEKLEFRTDGNMAVISPSINQEILWESKSSTLLDRDNIYFANRAIITNDGEFILTDTITYSQYYSSFNYTDNDDDISLYISQINDNYSYLWIVILINMNILIKDMSFYATWIDYFNCLDNEYIYGQTTPCVAYKYCSPEFHFENFFL